jgi:hypothetical protein
MMSYEQWLEYILEIVRAIASREHQEKVWLGPRPEIDWVGDLYNALDEEFFEGFFKRYSDGFTPEQLIPWNEFKQRFENYGEKLPRYPDPQTVIDDPEWQVVREAAARFLRAFERSSSKASAAAHAELSQGREDAYGAATSRAEAQVLRLSAIYAAFDRSPVVDACHLHAALAVWYYCRDSARLLFDTAPIDPTAGRISQALDVTPEGLSGVQIRALFNRHVSKDRIDLALEQLMTLGLINRETSCG